ncbi:MAG: ABC transporter permease [Anaerolineae bacterium]
MDALNALARLTGVEMLKFWRKPAARLVLGLMLLGPAAGEGLLALVDREDAAVFPQVTTLLFAGETLLFISLMMVVVAVLALGNDYELGTVRSILTRGVDRYQFVLSKVIATVVTTLVNGFAYMTSGLLATCLAHVTFSSVPLVEAAGHDLLWRALGAVLVVGLTGFVSAGVVMLALVLGRSSWIGILAGLGSFLGDFCVGALGLTMGDTDAYRYTVTYHALSLLERCFASDPHLRMSSADWLSPGRLPDPGRAVAVLLFYACAFTSAAILLFRRQDLTVKT